MERRQFIGAASALLAAGPAQAQKELQAGGTGSTAYTADVSIERKQAGKPHRGKVLAAIQPHCDDIPIFAGGTILKLIDEGYTGVLITMSNDSMAGTGSSIGDIVLKNERDTKEVAKRLGLTDAYFLNYPNHNMDGWPILEMRARLVFLFRLLKVDTVLVYDPSALYERNPDHYVTAKAVESACWIAGSEWDYPEHFKAGLKPHGPSEKYYFARGPAVGKPGRRHHAAHRSKSLGQHGERDAGAGRQSRRQPAASAGREGPQARTAGRRRRNSEPAVHEDIRALKRPDQRRSPRFGVRGIFSLHPAG